MKNRGLYEKLLSTYPGTAKPQAAAACGLAPNPDRKWFWDRLLAKNDMTKIDMVRNKMAKIGLMMLGVGALVFAVNPASADDPAHANLVAYYTFDTDFNDSEGVTAENGTSVGGASIQSGTVKLGSGALELDGNNDSVEAQETLCSTCKIQAFIFPSLSWSEEERPLF